MHKKVNQRIPHKIPGAELKYTDSEEFQQLLFALNGLRNLNGQSINGLIVGDSHMQCEDFGIALRKYFNDSLLIPQGGKGFIFPYPLARTSHRSDNHFWPAKDWHGCRFTKESNECPWGIAGWTAHFRGDSTEFSWENGSRFLAGDSLILFCSESSRHSFQLQISTFDQNWKSVDVMDKQLGFKCLIENDCPKLMFRISRTQNDSSEFVLQGIVHKSRQNGISIGITGTNGARLDHYLLNPEFGRHLNVIKPDFLLISLGTNESFSPSFDQEQIRKFLSSFLVRVKAAVPQTAIILMGPPDHRWAKKSNPRIQKINQLFSETAEQLGFVFWDQQKAMGGPGAVFHWKRKGLVTKDMVHFTPAGYQLQAQLLGRAIKHSLSQIPN